MLLNLGSICMLSAFAFLKGGFYQYFVKELLIESKERRIYALGYYISILLSVYASLILKSYLLTLITMTMEMIFLLYFVCSSFPGGASGLNYMGGIVCSLFKNCFRRK